MKPYYPALNLPDNILEFCALLRLEQRFKIGPAEVADALRSLEALGLHDLERSRSALRLVLCSKLEEVAPFDVAFDAFFFPEVQGQPQDLPDTVKQRRVTPSTDAADQPADAPTAPQPEPDEDPDDGFEGAAAQQRVSDEEDPDAPPAQSGLRAEYSALATGLNAAPVIPQSGLEAMLGAAQQFMSALRLGRSRKWRAAPKGSRFDLRRTLRGSLSTGGEALYPRWQAHPKRNPRVVLLLDGSRSMESHNASVLQFAFALSQRSKRVDVFTFSTELRDITRDLHMQIGSVAPRAAPQAQNPLLEARLGFKLPDLHTAWGGGTRIGGSVQAFLHDHAHRTLTPNTLVIVSSDGLDVGELPELQSAMRELQRRSAGVLWLNPLASLEGYAPTARGMRAALPFIARLTHASTPAEFAALTEKLRLR